MLRRRRLDLEHVQGGAGYFPVNQVLVERVFVDNSAPGTVNQEGAGLHQVELPLTDKVGRLPGQWHADNHVVGIAEQIIRPVYFAVSQPVGFLLRHVRVINDYLHIKSHPALMGQLRADSTQPDDTQLLVL